jgi:hypothetical protein
MSVFKNYTPEQVEDLLSNYLIDAWSYSRVSTFARNEKEFEMRYIYGERSKSSSTTIAGQAYHRALEFFFLELKDGNVADIVDLQQEAFEHINSQPADVWKISKTRPTVQDCINASIELSNKGIANFLSGIKTYTSRIKEVLDVELRLNCWLTINGVDIPLPCNLAIDLVVITNTGKRAIIDHKLRSAFTDEKDVKFTIGKQAITYVKGYESEYGEKIDEVWFIENKTSKNKDGSPQLAFNKVEMDDSTRRLYEAILYEPLRRMVSAAGDPDYVYLINDNDNLTEKAELYEFWAKTMLAEVEEFNIKESKKRLIEKRLKKIRDASLATATPAVIRNFKKYAQEFISYDLTNKDMTTEEKIEHVLRSFNIVAKVQHTFIGYSSVSYLLEISAGTSISNVNRYRLDIANALNVSNIRIQKDLYVYDGKSYLAIESGKKNTGLLLWDKSKLNGNKIPIGVDNFQQTVIWNLDNHSTPHMLICGATGSGKSVSIKSTIEYALAAGIKDIYIFDPKYEFTEYNQQKGTTVVNEIEDIEEQMRLLVLEMEERVKSKRPIRTLIVFDEFADAVANSKKGNELKKYEHVEVGMYKDGRVKTERKCVGENKSLEENLRVLLQKGRSSGFRIIAATQRASTKVITGDAKVNFPVQICFRVPKDIDSIVVIDEPGAESLNGRGDGLIKSPEYLGVVRFQAFYFN